MKAKLMLHAGASLASWEDVQAVPTPSEKGKVGHASLVERIQRYLAFDQFTVEATEFALAKNGDRFFALMQLGHASLLSQDHAYVMGLRNSHDKSFAASVCVGISPFVCDNLAFSPGQDGLVVNRRHVGTIHADLSYLVGSMVEKLVKRFQVSDKRAEFYKRQILSQRDADHIVCELWRNGVILPTDIRRVLAEYQGQTVEGKTVYRHEEFAPRTAYSLFQGLTQVLKGIDKDGKANPDLWSLPRVTADAFNLFDRLTGFTVDIETGLAVPDTRLLIAAPVENVPAPVELPVDVAVEPAPIEIEGVLPVDVQPEVPAIAQETALQEPEPIQAVIEAAPAPKRNRRNRK